MTYWNNWDIMPNKRAMKKSNSYDNKMEWTKKHSDIYKIKKGFLFLFFFIT